MIVRIVVDHRRLMLATMLGLLPALGCQGGSETVSRLPLQGTRLTIAVPDQTVGNLVRPLLDEWAQTSGAECELIIASRGAAVPDGSQSAGLKPSESRSSQGDLLIFPGDQIGNLIDEGTLAPLDLVPPAGSAQRQRPGGAATSPPNEPARAESLRISTNLQELPQPFREKVVRYGEQRMALPMGGSVFVLAYRRDLFDNAELQSAAQSAGIELKPPATWEALDRLAHWFAQRDRDGDGKPDPGLALAYMPGGDAELIYLSRVASLALSPDHAAFLFDLESMQPLVTTAPWLEATRAHADLAAALPGQGVDLDATAARLAFREGKVPMLIDRAEHAAAWTNVRAPLAIGVARLPGSSRFFDPDRSSWNPVEQPNAPPVLPSGGGWMVGISSQTQGQARNAAIDLVRFLAAEETARTLAANVTLPMLPVHSRLILEGLPDPRAMLGVDSPAWGRAVEDTLSDPRCHPSLRIPDAAGYLADLAAMRAKIQAGADIATALKELHEAWNARTDRLGRARQIWHHRRSLNRLTDSETPPPRTTTTTTTPTP
jgi:multiple sugar transport system substrate-binding protein